MPPTKQAAIRQSITLKGSTELVTEFFKYAVNTWVIDMHGRLPAQVKPFFCVGSYFNGECIQPMTFTWSRNTAKPYLLLKTWLWRTSSRSTRCYPPRRPGDSHTISRILKQVSGKRVAIALTRVAHVPCSVVAFGSSNAACCGDHIQRLENASRAMGL
jgi:hypothetical protein